MSWIGPVAKRGVKYGVKYGPQAKILWDRGGKHVQAAVREKAEEASARRTAFQKAETVVNGSVLKQIDAGKPVWVVYTDDEPVDAFPKPSVPLATLVEHADLSARVTPEDYRAHQLRERARRVQARLPRGKGAGRGATGELDAKTRAELDEGQQ